MFRNLLTFLFLTVFSFNIMAEEPKTEPVKHLSEEEIYQMLKKFATVFETARENFVEEVDEKKVLEGAINGMLTELDPHSSYLSEEDLKNFSDRTSGSFGGLGIQITADRGAIKVISPIDDSPAQKAGVKAGDYITHINGEQVSGMTLNQAIKKMKGKPGTKVKITVLTPGNEPRTLNLKRDLIKTKSVKSELKENVGTIRISDFGAKTVREVESEIKKMEQEAKKNKKEIVGYVLDVRNNPGGFLSAAVGVSDLFLDSGDIVSTRGRDKTDIDIQSAKAGDITNGKPLVVLINHGSASASEIVAGAIQDNKRGVIMGTQSFGKGSVQQQRPLGDGTAIHITISRYYTPNGTSIQAKGITPDVEVLQSKVEALEKKEDIFSESTLVGALKNEDEEDITKSKDSKDSNKEEKKLEDYQMNRAVDMVKALHSLNIKPKTKEETK